MKFRVERVWFDVVVLLDEVFGFVNLRVLVLMFVRFGIV